MNSGIYQIQNIVNNKAYIGSTRNLNRRKADHFNKLSHNKHSNKHLQNAFNKYGQDAFVFEIIEYCDPDQLIIREQWYLDNWNPEYNIRIKAENNSGLTWSKITRQKILIKLLGRKLSEDTKNKISKSMLGKNVLGFGKEHPSSKPVAQLNILTGEVISIYDNIRIAETHTNIDHSNISKVCRGKYKQAGGYSWKYI